MTEKSLTENSSGVKSFQKGDVSPVKENLIDIVENKMSGHVIYFISLFKIDDWHKYVAKYTIKIVHG